MQAFRPLRPSAWAPKAVRRGEGHGQSGELATPWTKIARRLDRHDVTSISGQVLATNGLPLQGIHVSVANGRSTATTDEAGRFLLSGHLPAGHDVLIVEDASPRPEHYGSYQMGVDVPAGVTTVLPYTIWLAPLDPSGYHPVKSPTEHEVRLTTPRIPGLEVRIPAGTAITAPSGRAIDSLNITPVPVDRTPFPLPPFVEVPVYFTVQPGRAYLSKGAQIIYPNWSHAAPGQRVPFWNYDATKRGWYVYGYGTVTANGKQVAPDPGVRVWEFSGAMITGSLPPPGRGPKNGASSSGGEPVDLQSGLFVQSTADLLLPGPMSIDIERTYRQGDPNSYMFGIGTASPYDTRLWSNNNYQSADLVLPDGGDVHYVRTSPGTGFTEAVYEAKTTPGPYYHSRISYDTSLPGWHLSLTSGITYDFGEVAPLQSIHDRYGNRITLTRESGQSGNITQITSSNGTWVKLSYEGSLVKEAMDNGGRHVKYSYENSRLVSVTDAASHVTKYAYNAAGDMTSIIDPRGNKFIENEYDSNDRVATQHTADGGTFTFTYNLSEGGEATATTVTEPSGSKRRVTFNEQGFPTSEALAVGSSLEQTTAVEREVGTGRVLSETDPRGRRTTFAYDAFGNATEVTRLAGTSEAATTKYEYEPNATNLVKETDPIGHITTFEYGSHGEPRKMTDPLGHSTTYEYNGEGLRTKETDANGHSTTFEYTHGMLVATTDALGRTSSQFVDALGRVARKTDADGSHTLYVYDGDNNLTALTDPRGVTTTFEYNADNELSAVTDPRGNKSSISYNAMDRIESETDALGHVAKSVYNTSGDPIESINRDGHHTTLEYDALGRLSHANYNVTSKSSESELAYTYDNGNRLTRVTDSASGEYTLAYNEADQTSEVKAPNGSIGYTYDGDGRRKTMTIAGQQPVEYAYDVGGRLAEITRASDHVKVGYDPANQPTELTLPDGVAQRYTYDSAGEPTMISYVTGANTLGELNYAYGARGEIDATWGSFARASLPEPVSSVTYNANNEQTNLNGTPLTYDVNGDLTSDGASEYKWNARGQLTSVAGSHPATYAYDAFGQRSSKTLAGVTTKLLMDGGNPALETEGTAAPRTFLTGFSPGELYSRTGPSGTDSYLMDAPGSVIALANPAASITTSYTYSPFGVATETGTPSTNRFQFNGAENDGDGLEYNSARYYSYGSTRFISPDPLGMKGSGVNLYAYGANDPVNLADPTGLGVVASVGNFFAGAADSLTFGGSTWLLNQVGIHPNTCSLAFNAGQVAGYAAALFVPGGAALDLARGAGLGLRFGRGVAIGENMAGRVIPFAEKYGLDYYHEPVVIKVMPVSTRMWYNNLWVDNAMNATRNIYDIGIDATRPVRSPFHAMETESIAARNYEYHFQVPGW